MPDLQVFGYEPELPLYRYVQSLSTGSRWLALALLFVLTVALAIRFRFPRERGISPSAHLTWIVALLGIAWAWNLRWMSDDAFISFRYASNWVHGNGLVYNVGERVEGYTNFLWTVISALAIAIGLHPGQVSIVLTLAAMVGTIWTATQLVRRLMPPGMPFIVSFAGAALAANYAFASFATSGMETVPAALLVLLAVQRAQAREFWQAGLLTTLATLMHPDHLLFFLALGVAVALERGPRRRHIIEYIVPFAALFVPYFLWRWHYYGDFYPNTYYAKSGGSAYYAQGIVYLWVSSLALGILGALPLAIWGAVRYANTLTARFAIIGVPLYLIYVAKIGGDFMLGRLFCPILPPLFVMAELGARDLLARERTVAWAVLGLMLFALAGVPNSVVRENEKYYHLADERTFYPLQTFEPLVVASAFTDEAVDLERAFEGAPRTPRLGVGCIGIVGFQTGFEIMDNWGLANRTIGHMKVRRRGRPGHEKLAQPGHFFEHDVDFSDIEVWPRDYAPWVGLRIGRRDYWVVKYDAKMMNRLRAAPSNRVVDLERIMLNYAANSRNPERRACDHWFFEQIYFAHQTNPALRARLVQSFVSADAQLTGVEDLLLRSDATTPANWRQRILFDFETLKGWTNQGTAFAQGPISQEVPGQQRVFGHTGRFVNSFDPKLMDMARGKLISPPFVIQGDAITLRVAGGMLRDAEQVRLVVDDQVVAAATGCASEAFGRRIWPVAMVKGKQARLEIIDQYEGNWSHILVDDVREWQRIQ